MYILINLYLNHEYNFYSLKKLKYTMWKTLCKMDREKSSHSIRQFPLTSTQLNYIFILQEHKLNFSGKRGPMTSASLSMLISCRGAKGKRKQQTVNNERSWKTRGKHRSKEGRRSRWLRKETCGNWGIIAPPSLTVKPMKIHTLGKWCGWYLLPNL